MDFSDRLIPGDGNPDGSDRGDWKACGLADGVIFYGDVEAFDPETRGTKIVKAGKERQALRYLLGPGMASAVVKTDMHARVCEAIDRALTHPGSIGLCVPVVTPLLFRHPEIEQEAIAAGFPLERLFLSSKAGIDANQPQHVKRWQVKRAEEGIWCVFYV